MAAGGIYDQVGGGFARYAVDATWTVPHFEKMLYDNALLARAYLHGWQVSGEQRCAASASETLDWALREMRGPEGGFCSALDADSEGVEGKFYVWTLDELRAALGDERCADEAVAYFGATESGNFEGANVLEGRGPVPERLPEIRRPCWPSALERVRPGLDDKRLTSWNALMISALAEAGRGARAHRLRRPPRSPAPSSCSPTCATTTAACCAPGRTAAPTSTPTWRTTRYLLEALLTLYEATFDPRWYARGARRWPTR